MNRGEAGDPPAGTSSAVPEPERPARPVLVELASALLIVTGALSALTSLQVIAALEDQAASSGQLVLLSFGIAVAGVVLGVLVRYGRAWLVTINIVAVAGFLELTSGSPIGIAFGVLDVLVLLALFREKPWFDWTPEGSGRLDDEDRDG